MLVAETHCREVSKLVQAQYIFKVTSDSILTPGQLTRGNFLLGKYQTIGNLLHTHMMRMSQHVDCVRYAEFIHTVHYSMV